MKKIILAISLLTILAGCQQQRLDKDSPEFDEKKGKVLFQGKLYTGIVFEYHRDTNTLKYEHTYKEGIMEGEYKEYYRNGQLEVKGNYIAGEREGKFESWSETGQLLMEFNFKDESNTILKEFHENGKLHTEYYFKNEK